MAVRDAVMSHHGENSSSKLERGTDSAQWTECQCFRAHAICMGTSARFSNSTTRQKWEKASVRRDVSSNKEGMSDAGLEKARSRGAGRMHAHMNAYACSLTSPLAPARRARVRHFSRGKCVETLQLVGLPGAAGSAASAGAPWGGGLGRCGSTGLACTSGRESDEGNGGEHVNHRPGVVIGGAKEVVSEGVG